MKRLLRNILSLCLLHAYAISSASVQELKYGLEFNSFETMQEKRTGLNLTPTKPFSFPNGFTMSFDVCFHSKHKFNYGYVFRIIGQNGQHVDFLFNRASLIVTHSLEKTIAEFPFDEIKFEYDTYYSFEIQFDTKNSILNVSLGGKQVSAKNLSLKDFNKTNIVFGKCDYPQYQVSDIPRMLVKDIRINNHKGNPVYHWPLSKHALNGIYDEVKREFASVENPQWALDNHALWQRELSFNTKRNPQISYNPDKNAISVFDQTSYYSYNIHTMSLTEDILNKGVPHNYYTNQTVYNPFLYSYYSYFDIGKDVISYDLLKNRWDNLEKERISAYHLHHNKIISPFDSCLYVFGGYGHYKYNDEVNKYDFKTNVWETLHFTGDHIQPRYLSGLGVIDETRVLIFGGYGSETGAQELSAQNYYDMYIVDIKEKTVKKIWELLPPKDNFAVVNSIVVDTLNKCFYTLCFPQQRYNTSLFLGKFSLEKPEYEMFTNNIPYAFQDIHSYADLFLDKNTNKLIAITSSPVIVDSTSIVSVYSLLYPPLFEADLYQKDDRQLSGFWLFFIITTCLLSMLGGGFVYLKRKRKLSQNDLESSTNSNSTIRIFEDKKAAESKPNKQAIFLLGGFHVVDKMGNDITGEFSPLLKQLFLIILLNTLKDGKGISSLKLRETLWFDKTQESARNNRGVLLSRLRQVLERVGVVSIENQNSYWVVELGSDIYCDYSESIVLIKRMKTSNITSDDVRKLLSIVLRGELLLNLQVDWLDSFKADFSNGLIDILLDIAQLPNLKLSLQEQVNLADAIFIHDSLSEDALRLKCQALLKMKKNGLAKAIYSSFIKEYQASFETKFKDSFDQIVSS